MHWECFFFFIASDRNPAQTGYAQGELNHSRTGEPSGIASLGSAGSGDSDNITEMLSTCLFLPNSLTPGSASVPVRFYSQMGIPHMVE